MKINDFSESEKKIIKNWKPKENPVVSICCITYNHESYISVAIDGFLMQETDFPFEIIIRDDCSTDKTALIIRQYAEKYPNIIKPIYETENQFSKGVRPMPVVYKKAKGEYFALCEGDDYWSNSLKLQYQVEYMNKHQGVALSFHYSSILLINNEVKVFCRNKIGGFFSTEDVINNWFIPTHSIMFRRECLKLYFEVYDHTEIVNGDWALMLICSTYGKIGYIDKNMGVYRKHQSSLSATIGKNQLYRYEKLALLFDIFDNFTNKKYSFLINNKKIDLYRIMKSSERRKKYPIFYRIMYAIKRRLFLPKKYK